MFDFEKNISKKINFTGVCGITIATDFREGATNSSADIEIGNLAMDFEVGLYSHPIFSSTGGFPEAAVKRVAEKSAQQGFPRTRLPQLTEEEVDYIKGKLMCYIICSRLYVLLKIRFSILIIENKVSHFFKINMK